MSASDSDSVSVSNCLPRSVQCNKKARRSDIVLLYAPKLKALDNTEQESLKK